MRIVFDQKGKAKKDPKKKGMIHIEVIRDKVSNQKTYIPTNVKILFEHHTDKPFEYWVLKAVYTQI